MFSAMFTTIIFWKKNGNDNKNFHYFFLNPQLQSIFKKKKKKKKKTFVRHLILCSLCWILSFKMLTPKAVINMLI